jgi:MoxR-like ATPase
MKIQINSKELFEILKLTPASQNILLVGKHGIGKSEIITQFYSEKGMKVISFFLGQMSDSGDLIGLMYKNEETGISEFLPPFWWPAKDEPIVLFLDELNRARPEILQSIMDLALNKTLAGKRLPNNSVIISAINEGDEYQLTDLDPALISRFNMYSFKPTVDEWLLWATKQNLDARIIQFISNNKNYLDTLDLKEDSSDLEKYPDRRSWVRVSEVITDCELLDELKTKLIAGIIGVKAALNFVTSLQKNQITPSEILNSFSKVKSKLESKSIIELSDLNTGLCIFLESVNEDLSTNDTKIKNLEKYIYWLSEHNFNEVIAHFVSELENENYQKMNQLVFIESKTLGQFITTFISSI